MNANTTRFSDRVEDYVKYRPAYPLEMLEMLRSGIGLNKDFVIADIGSGTGISSVLFLKNGNTVFAVEPNKEMREAAELKFAGNPNFISVDGSAEHSTLNGESIDVIFCGQAFHWFDRIPTKTEFTRILKKTGHIILAWNDRNVRDKFQQEYEQILVKYIPEYLLVNHKNVSNKDIMDFFQPKSFHMDSFNNSQTFNLEGLKGRLTSSSYCPKTGNVYKLLMKEVEILFNKFEKNGHIIFDYETKMYWC